ncbi:hypothetical protein D4764_16G0001740 [Takifugu flavidus]|uniref:Alkylated DNA repair protein AlkB homologue 8 N-terminal domain-containing protein n=1 Tax=Takifugu flavidus TaxID=433684 RepID=A0A5C6P0T2_9TELE|nr:hypothetical protein D4764_16G0001740 [Takifugu flavidus]
MSHLMKTLERIILAHLRPLCIQHHPAQTAGGQAAGSWGGSPPAPVNILGTDVDVVESYKYLGVHLNNNLDWTHNTDALVKKGNSRLFLLRRVSSIMDRKRMDRLVRRAGSVLGCPLDSVEVVGNGRMMAKLSSMLNNTSHPLQDTLTALGSSFSERLLHPRCVKEKYRRSCLPADVRLHNKQRPSIHLSGLL